MAHKQEKFDSPDKAVDFVTAGLASDYPDAVIEIIQVVRNRPRKARCEALKAAPILHKACEQFPRASVEYHPSNPYGFIAEIRCHGEHKGGATVFERHTTDRPRVLIMVTRVGEKEVLVGSHKVPKTPGVQ